MGRGLGSQERADSHQTAKSSLLRLHFLCLTERRSGLRGRSTPEHYSQKDTINHTCVLLRTKLAGSYNAIQFRKHKNTIKNNTFSAVLCEPVGRLLFSFLHFLLRMSMEAFNPHCPLKIVQDFVFSSCKFPAKLL